MELIFSEICPILTCLRTYSSIKAIFEIEQKTKVVCHLFTCGVSAGVPPD
jgi:hypothetical protein